MKTLIKIFMLFICIALILCTTLSLSSCASNDFQIDDNDIVKEEGEITFTPYQAEYNDDGSLSLVIAAYNGTKYSKILTEVNIVSLTDEKGRVIAEDIPFTLVETKYLDVDSVSYFQCDFEADQVKLNTKLRQLTLTVEPYYNGCIHNGKTPDKSNNDLAVAFIDAEINSTLGFDGTLYIRNDKSEAVSINSIAFDIFTDSSIKLNETTVTKDVNVTLKPSDEAKLSISISAADVNTAVSSEQQFNTLIVKNIKIS